MDNFAVGMPKMKVFISWSGERSEALAKALKEWLPLALHYADPWMSQSDIDAGDRWGSEIAKGLEVCNFGIICVTKENLSAPWILFEAGALAKSMQDSKVIPLLLDMDKKDVSGPLAQFQAKKVNFEEIKDLVNSLNKSSQNPIEDSNLNSLYPLVWPKLDSAISGISKSVSAARSHRPQGEILEELVSSVRGVEGRLRDVMDDDRSLRRRNKLRYGPMMMEEMLHRFFDDPYDPIILLIYTSHLRDDVPWVYELALDVYRSIQARDVMLTRELMRKFVKILEAFRKGPFAEEFGMDRKHIQMVLFEVIPRLEKIVYNSVANPKRMSVENND